MVTEPADHPRLPTARLLLLCAALGVLASLVHVLLVDLPNLPAQLAWHRAILAGTGPYPDQYRLLTYALAEGLMRLGLPFIAAHEILRGAFTAGALFALTRALEHWLDPPWPLTGLLLAAVTLPLTFLFYDMQPTDPLNFLIFAAAFVALERGRDAWLLPLVVVGMANRETAALLPVLQALVRAGRAPLRRWLPVALAGAALAIGVYLGLRAWLGLRPPYAPLRIAHYWRVNLLDPAQWWPLLAFFNLALVFAWRGFARRPPFLRRAAWLVPLFLALHVTVGYLRETRYFLPLLPVTLALTLLAIAERAGRRDR